MKKVYGPSGMGVEWEKTITGWIVHFLTITHEDRENELDHTLLRRSMVSCPVICVYDTGSTVPLNYHVGFTAVLEKDLIFRP